MTLQAEQVPLDLRAIRVGAGLSVREVGGAVAVHPTTVLRWERRERLPGPVHLRDLARAYELPVPEVAAFFDHARKPAGRMDGAPGRGLRRLRRMHDLRAARLAEILGVPTHTVYNWEAGRARIPSHHLGPLAERFSLDVRTLERMLQRWSTWRPSDATRQVTPLRRLRRRAGLTQIQLAHAACVGLTSLKAWEKGQPPSLQGLRGLARALDLSTETVARATGLSLPAELRPAAWRPGELPRVLLVLRRWSQLTQEQLAVLCECSTSSVRGWEQGRLRPGPRSRDRLERLYRLEEGALLASY